MEIKLTCLLLLSVSGAVPSRKERYWCSAYCTYGCLLPLDDVLPYRKFVHKSAYIPGSIPTARPPAGRQSTLSIALPIGPPT
jgi:hypothetical protein